MKVVKEIDSQDMDAKKNGLFGRKSGGNRLGQFLDLTAQMFQLSFQFYDSIFIGFFQSNDWFFRFVFDIAFFQDGAVVRGKDVAKNLSDVTRYCCQIFLKVFCVSPGSHPGGCCRISSCEHHGSGLEDVFLKNRLQKLYALDKVGLSDQHHQIDGVKILFAGKTSGQIGLWIYGGVIPVRTRGT